MCDPETKTCIKPECRNPSQCPDEEDCVDFKCKVKEACDDNTKCKTITTYTVNGETTQVCVANKCETGCSEYNACAYGFECVGNKCVQISYCKNDRNCFPPFRCEKGQCVYIRCLNSNCPPGQYCDENNICSLFINCGENNFCPKNTTCEDNMCVPTNPSDCTIKEDCDYGFACEGKKCVKYKCPSTCQYCYKDTCLDNCNDYVKCPPGFKCQSNRCVPEAKCNCNGKDVACYLGACITVICLIDEHCPGELRCNRGQKVCTLEGCRSDNNCKASFICPKEGTCKLPEECVSDSDCPKQHFCTFYMGRKICKIINIEENCNRCSQDQECDCMTSSGCICRNIGEYARRCSYDGDCPERYYCDINEQKCKPITSCYIQADCIQGYSCDPKTKKCIRNYDKCRIGYHYIRDKNMCVPKCPYDKKICNLAYYLSECKDNICVPTECSPKCEAGYECTSNNVCIRKSCTDCKYCTSDYDCPPEEMCKFGQCIKSCGTCPKLQKCVKGFCTEDENVCKKKDGYILINGLCIKVPECKFKSNCPSGMDCVKGFCKTVETTEFCNFDDNCEQFTYCKGNKCTCFYSKCHERCSKGTCPNGYKCMLVRGVQTCIQYPITGTCPYPGMMYINSVCVFPECSGSSDCAGRVCAL